MHRHQPQLGREVLYRCSEGENVGSSTRGGEKVLHVDSSARSGFGKEEVGSNGLWMA